MNSCFGSLDFSFHFIGYVSWHFHAKQAEVLYLLPPIQPSKASTPARCSWHVMGAAAKEKERESKQD